MRLFAARPAPFLTPMRLALAVWLLLGIAVSVRTVLLPTSHTVFPIFVIAAERFWSDQTLYDELPDLDYFRYPPPFAVVVSPVALLGPTLGGIVWAWLSIAALVYGLRRFAADVLPEDWGEARTAGLIALGALGAVRGLWNAQSNALIVGLLLVGVAELTKRRYWRSALWLGAAVGLKATPLPVVLLLLALYPIKLGPRLAVVLLAVGLVPFLTKPPAVVVAHYEQWQAHLRATSGTRWPGFRDAYTVVQAVRHTVEGRSEPFPYGERLDSATYRAVQLLTAGAALAWCLWLRRRLLSDRRHGEAILLNATLGIGCAWLLLFGPATEHPTYVFLAPSLAYALLARDVWPRGRWLAIASFVLVILLGWNGAARPFSEQVPLVLTALPLGTALFAAWLVGSEGARPGLASMAASSRIADHSAPQRRKSA